jgi:predicted HTH transcriptional regulator
MSELLHLIAKGEGIQLEFKTEVTDSKDIAATLVALANTKGGSVLIGVKDSGKIKGINPSEEEYMIEEAVVHFTKPKVAYSKSIWQERHYFVIEIEVDQSNVKHRALSEGGEWKSFVRIDDHTCHTNKIIDLAWKLSDTYKESPKYNEECIEEIINKLSKSHTTLSKLYAKSAFSLKIVDYNLSCLLYNESVVLLFVDEKVQYGLKNETTI